MDLHSIRTVREEARIQGRSIKELVYVEPEFKLQQVIDTLLDKKCSMAPIVTVDQDSERVRRMAVLDFHELKDEKRAQFRCILPFCKFAGNLLLAFPCSLSDTPLNLAHSKT